MKILICSDGSEAAERAVLMGALIAAGCNAEVTLLGIIEAPGKTEIIMEALRRGLRLLQEKKIHAETVTVPGQSIEEIIKRTTETKFDLVVIGAAQKETTGRFQMSFKAYKIIKSIQPPVLVVMGKASALNRVLLCSGGQKYIDDAVALTGRIAQGMKASVTLLHVMPETPALYSGLSRMTEGVEMVLNSKSSLGRNLRSEKAALEALAIPVEVKLLQGSVLQQILREMRAGNYDLVVTGSSLSRSGLRTYILGDISREIVNRATCAVLVVRVGKKHHLLQSISEQMGRFFHGGHGTKT